MQNLLSRIHSKYKDYKIIRIESGASKRNFYRLSKNSQSIICMDSSKDQKSYADYLKVHSYLKDNNISIPKIYDQYDKHNIFVLPSFTESYSQVIDESISRLRPVIIFKEISHIIGSRKGVYISERDEVSFLKKINFIMKNYKSIQKKIRQNVLPTKDIFLKEIANAIRKI